MKVNGTAVTEQEIYQAKTDFKKSGAEILFFLMVDAQGKVVKSRVVDRDSKKIKRESAEKFKRSTYKIEFKPASEGEPKYRQFIYPMQVNTSFEWL